MSRWHHGSPAHRYGIYALNWVTAVNGAAVTDLDSLVAGIKGLEHGASVRLKLVSLQAKPRTCTLKVDNVYWPAWELRRGVDDTWERHLI